MSLHELMGWAGPMTGRQFRAWREWELLDANSPSRSDHYLMQVAMEVAAGRLADGAAKLRLDQFKIAFEAAAHRPQPGVPADPREAHRLHQEHLKAALMGIVGPPAEVR